jgi:HK97 family phage major capsid protein
MPFFKVKKAWNGHAANETLEFSDADSVQPLLDTGWLEKTSESSASDLIAASVLKSIGPELATQVTKSIEPLLASLSAVNPRTRPAVGGGTDADDKTKSFGNFLKCVLNQDTDRISKVYATTKTPLAEATGTGGGYLVPPEYMAILLRLAGEKSIVRPKARVIPMTSRTIQVPALKQSNAAVPGQFQVLAGMYATWTEEAATRVETEPQFRQIELIAHELAGYSVASRTLMADSAIALDSLLTSMFADAIAMHEDYAFLVGDGVGKPLGIQKSPMTIISGPNAGGRTTSNTFKLADAAWMWSNLLPASQGNAVWIMSQSVIPQLIQLQDSAGNVLFLPNFYEIPDAAASGGRGGIQAGLVPMLFGRPIFFTEKVASLGNTGDVTLVDFNYYLVGDRQAIEVAASEHVNFLTNQMTWRFLHRVDGQPWLDAPYNYQDGVTQVSPCVVLHA